MSPSLQKWTVEMIFTMPLKWERHWIIIYERQVCHIGPSRPNEYNNRMCAPRSQPRRNFECWDESQLPRSVFILWRILSASLCGFRAVGPGTRLIVYLLTWNSMNIQLEGLRIVERLNLHGSLALPVSGTEWSIIMLLFGLGLLWTYLSGSRCR